MDESMEGMEVVLEDLLDRASDAELMSFSSSSLPSIHMVATEEDDPMEGSFASASSGSNYYPITRTRTSFAAATSSAAAASSKAAAPLVSKGLSGDASVTTLATTSCTSCDGEDENYLHWISLSSISETAVHFTARSR
jgi:hypothetical protein